MRLPKTLHEKLMARATDEGVSLSLLVATLLAAAHPYDFRPDDDEPEADVESGASSTGREDHEEPEPLDSDLELTP